MSLTVKDILASPDLTALRTDFVKRLNVTSLVLTDEFSGAFFRTLWELEALVVLDLIGADGTVEKLLDGAFVDGSSGDWLKLLAHAMYETEKIAGTFCTQTVTLAASAGAGPYIITAGLGRAVNAAGQGFIPISGGTLTGPGTLAVQFKAESAGASLGLINKLLSPNLGGVTVQGAVIFDPGTGPLYGSNAETDTALRTRLILKWPDLTAIDADDRIAKWVKAASTEITRLRLDVDTVNPGGVIITVAGVSGAVSGGAVTAAQAYVDARIPITDYPTVQNATNLNVTPSAGTVTVQVAQLAYAQAAANAAWLAALSVTKIGGTVYVSKLEQCLMDAIGVIDVIGLALTGGTPDIALASTQVPIKSGDLASQLTWVTV